MKKLMIIKLTSLCIVLSALTFSCRKSDRDNDRETTSSIDNAIGELSFNDVWKQINDAAENQQGIASAFSPNGNTRQTMACATITVDTTTNPKQLWLDFGTTNCAGSDGRLRRGVIYATFTGYYRDSSTIITITPNNYYVNDYKIDGTKTITNKGHNSSGNLWYTIAVQNGIITIPNTTPVETITWVSSRTREWIAGESTILNFSDDVYLITGTASGVGRHGNSFTASITTALRVELSCAHIVSGIFELTPQNLATRVVDYGTGICDNKATVTVNGYSTEITLW